LILLLAREVGSPLVRVLEKQQAHIDSNMLLAAADDVDQHFQDTPGERREAFCRIFENATGSRPSVFSALVRAPFAFFVTTNFGGWCDEGDTYDTQLCSFEQELDRFWADLLGPDEQLRRGIMAALAGLKPAWKAVKVSGDGDSHRHGIETRVLQRRKNV
jgi:hypothetical protein